MYALACIYEAIGTKTGLVHILRSAHHGRRQQCKLVTIGDTTLLIFFSIFVRIGIRS